jgi:cytochrome c556
VAPPSRVRQLGATPEDEMRLFKAGLCALGLVALTATADAQTPASPSPAEIVAARQAAMTMSGGLLSGLAIGANSGAEIKTFGYGAYGLEAWAKALQSLFPAGTGPQDVQVRIRAKPEIWSDPAGFAAAAKAFAESTTRLRQFAKQNDAAGFKAQLKDVEAHCIACHTAYRSGPV